MKSDTRWGVCATIKAPTEETLRFAAYYLDAGAHRVWIYLDAPDAEAHAALNDHPKCRVVTCDDAYWKRIFGRRPAKHQVRQTRNATRTYRRAGEVDWLLHADADEFVLGDRPIAEVLDTCSEGTITVRVRPMEALAVTQPHHGAQAFKKFIPAGPDRIETVRTLYPRFGVNLKGGFLSHVAGKMFVRTAEADMDFKIHNVFRGEEKNPSQIETDALALAHLHAVDWESWLTQLEYRLQKGAYRSELAPAVPEDEGGETLHDFFTRLRAEEGENGLRAFFEEVCADSKELRARLETQGLLALHDLQLDAKRHQVFPARSASASTV